jgi:hypothetical protein
MFLPILASKNLLQTLIIYCCADFGSFMKQTLGWFVGGTNMMWSWMHSFLDNIGISRLNLLVIKCYLGNYNKIMVKVHALNGTKWLYMTFSLFIKNVITLNKFNWNFSNNPN